jgi:hypothetical protein
VETQEVQTVETQEVHMSDTSADDEPIISGVPAEARTVDPSPGEVHVRTGAEQPWDPEDLAVAEGRDPTPANVERSRRELEELGPAAIEKTVP